MRKMIINAVDAEEVRIAILNREGVLEDLDIETRGVEKNKGNVYKGVVKAVEPALNAAFVNYGADKEGFLTASEVDSKYAHKKNGQRITDILKPGRTLLVQVVKDEVGTKGAVLTTHLSLAGRYLVLMPGANRTGVSRRIEDEETRRRMREATARLEVPEGMGVILRTAGRDRTKADLNRDLKVLLRLWDSILEKESHEKAPALIHKERDVVIRALRDYLTADVNEVVVDSDDAYDRAAEYMHLVMPRQKSVLTRYVERRPIFHHYRIEDQLDTLYAARVALPSGGSLVIEPTEALVAIDVNSGKQKHAGHEETALKTNLEAAAEVARQLRLRDLGGIVVIDFIDMLARRHQQQVEKALKLALKEDKARVKLGRISTNGTLELTRQRLRSALETSVFHECAVCRGSGQVLNPASHALAVLRRLRDRAAHGDLSGAKVRIERQAADILSTAKRKDVEALEGMHNIKITVVSDPYLVAGQESFSWELNPNAEPIELPTPDFGPPEQIEAPKKTRRRRRRKRVAPTQRSEQPLTAEPPEDPFSDNGSQPAAGRSDRGTCEDDQLDLGLPTFELFDVDTFRERERKEATLKSSNGSKKKSSRRRRRSRRSKQPTADIIACAPLPLADPPPKKGVSAFLKRLFGMRA